MTIEDDDDLALPAALAAIAAIGFPVEADEDEQSDDEPEEGEAPEHPPVDFEPFEEFLDPDDTADWFRGWTGNPEADADQFRVFGQTADGGYAAFWLVREDAPLAEQLTTTVAMRSSGRTSARRRMTRIRSTTARMSGTSRRVSRLDAWRRS